MKFTNLLISLICALGVPVAALGQTVFYSDPTTWSQQLTTSPILIVFPNPNGQPFSPQLSDPFTVNGVSFSDPSAAMYMTGTANFEFARGGNAPLTITLPNSAYAVGFFVGNYQNGSGDNITVTLGNGATQNIFATCTPGIPPSQPLTGTCTFVGAVSSVGFNTITVTDNGPYGAYGGDGGLYPWLQNIEYALLSVPPTAVGGTNQTINAGQTVHLNGRNSFAPNTPSASLAYAWSFVSTPSGSTTTLMGPTTITPSFLADEPGTYVVQLVVTDPATSLSSSPSQVIVSSIWSPPTANAGSGQAGVVGVAVALSGSGVDPNALPLTFVWSLLSEPAGSASTLAGANSQNASFTPDVAGAYTVGLVVSDEFGSSAQSTATVSVITTSDYAQQQTGNAVNYVAGTADATWKAPGLKNAFTNFLQQAIAAIQAGNTSLAKEKLTNAITRTDGCPLRGAVDGPGPSMDWVIDCTAQGVLYTDLTNALNILP
jgi:hypothetical protein